MIRSCLAFVVAVSVIGIATSSIAAETCSSWKQTCIASSPNTKIEDNIQKCSAAAKDCQARCKKGQKSYFVGPFNGQQHPVDSCG